VKGCKSKVIALIQLYNAFPEMFLQCTEQFSRSNASFASTHP